MLDKKIALCLKGVHYIPNRIDFKNSNIKDTIIYGNNVDVFIYSYDTDRREELISFYNPKEYHFVDNTPIFKEFVDTKNNRQVRNLKTTNGVLKMIDPDKYDFVVLTRFDIIFKKRIFDFNVDLDKINICFKDIKTEWDSFMKVGDNLFIIPTKMLNFFIQSIDELIVGSQNLNEKIWGKSVLHCILMKLTNYITIDDINFMVDGYFSSNTRHFENPIFTLTGDRILEK